MKRIHALSYGSIGLLLLVLAVSIASGSFAWKTPRYSIGYFNCQTNAWGSSLFQDGLHTAIQLNAYKTFSISGDTAVFAKTNLQETTIAFSRDDIIFDAAGNVYTESKTNELATIQELSGMPLTKTQQSNREAIVIPSFFYLVNPHIPGALAIQIPTAKTVLLDLEEKTITIPQGTKLLVVHAYQTMPKKHL